jgi:hypothetical protein
MVDGNCHDLDFGVCLPPLLPPGLDRSLVDTCSAQRRSALALEGVRVHLSAKMPVGNWVRELPSKGGTAMPNTVRLHPDHCSAPLGPDRSR